MIKKLRIFWVTILLLIILTGLTLIMMIKAKGMINKKFFEVCKFIKPDEELGWRLKPGYHNIFYLLNKPFGEIRINSNGIRDDKAVRDLKDKFIILGIGDSTTFGWGVDNYGTYPYILEQAIDNKKFAVLNGGVPGYSISQIKKYFIKNLEEFNPRLVIISGGINDTVITHSLLWNFTAPFFIRKIIFKYNFVSLVNRLKRNKTKIICTTIPTFRRWKEADEINEIIRSVSSRLNVNLVDIADIFKKKRSKELYAEIDQVINIYFHPSKKGNRIIAQEIIAEMRKMGIL